jgi:Fe-S cluster assembly iron-binding protein IscA
MLRRFASLTLTQACSARIKQICQPPQFLRVAVDGGEGCSGFMYHFNVDDKLEPEDQ